MTADANSQSIVSRPRFQIVDIVRGIAIIAMIFYHLFWDLSYFGLIGVNVSTEPSWIAFQHTIVATFLTLAGVSLVLAHGNGIRWRPFWRRFGILVAAALIVSVATYFMFPETFVYFGVLHAIALFSLLALPFLRLPIPATFLVAALVIALPAFVHSPIFFDRWLSWIGLWDVPPPANDLVPVFPWFGFVLFGVGLARLVLGSSLHESLGRFSANGKISRGLIFCGRWSLLIYLVHQPILFGIVYPIHLRMTPEPTRAEAFAGSCQKSCVQTSGRAGYCQAYCACALDMIETGNLWSSVNATQPTAKDRQSIAEVTTQCSTASP